MIFLLSCERSSARATHPSSPGLRIKRPEIHSNLFRKSVRQVRADDAGIGPLREPGRRGRLRSQGYQRFSRVSILSTPVAFSSINSLTETFFNPADRIFLM